MANDTDSQSNSTVVTEETRSLAPHEIGRFDAEKTDVPEDTLHFNVYNGTVKDVKDRFRLFTDDSILHNYTPRGHKDALEFEVDIRGLNNNLNHLLSKFGEESEATINRMQEIAMYEKRLEDKGLYLSSESKQLLYVFSKICVINNSAERVFDALENRLFSDMSSALDDANELLPYITESEEGLPINTGVTYTTEQLNARLVWSAHGILQAAELILLGEEYTIASKTRLHHTEKNVPESERQLEYAVEAIGRASKLFGETGYPERSRLKNRLERALAGAKNNIETQREFIADKIVEFAEENQKDVEQAGMLRE